MKPGYNRSQMAEALTAAGLRRGDIVFSHANVGFFGFPEEGTSAAAILSTIYGAFRDVIGEEGTLVVPTFTYSFCRGQPFDPDNTPSTCGIFSEMIRTLPEAIRSQEGIHSVAAVGPLAADLVENVSEEGFGENSFWDRFYKADGIVCNMNFDAGSTFIHYVERCLNIPYRYDKIFKGTLINKGKPESRRVIFFCQDLSNPDTVAHFETFDRRARELGAVRTAGVGRGAIVYIRARDVYSLIEQELQRDPWFLTVSAGGNKAPLLLKPVDLSGFKLELAADASMPEMIKSLGPLRRDLLSDGYDAALESLSGQVSMSIHAYPTGTHFGEQIVPEKWICEGAQIKTPAGHRLFPEGDSSFRTAPYSRSFSGEVSREELGAHLITYPELEEHTDHLSPADSLTWAFFCEKEAKESLKESSYQVEIRSRFEYGTVKIGEVRAGGESEQCILLWANLAGFAEANNAIAGVALGIEIMRRLLKRTKLRFTYELLITPGAMGLELFLNQHKSLLPLIQGAVFLQEISANRHPSLLTLSSGNSEFERFCIDSLGKHHPEMSVAKSAQAAPWRKIVGSIPTVALAYPTPEEARLQQEQSRRLNFEEPMSAPVWKEAFNALAALIDSWETGLAVVESKSAQDTGALLE